MSWNLNLNERENLNAEHLLSQCLLNKTVNLEFRYKPIWKELGIDEA